MKRKLGLIAGGFGVILSIAVPASAIRADDLKDSDPATRSAPPATISSQPAPDFDSQLTGDWFGARTKLSDAGVTIGATLCAEGFANFMGGIDTQHLLGSTTFDLNVTLDLDKLAHLSNAEIYCDLESHAFRNPTTDLVGDIQVFDNNNNFPYLQFYELWYQQSFFDGVFRVKVGKVDANTEFCVIDYGKSFISSSAQVSPSIFIMPTQPDPAPSVNLFFTPQGGFFASFGVYYANKSEQFGDILDDPSSVQASQYGAFLIGETGLRWDALPALKYAGNFKVGAWGHTGTFQRFDGTPQDGTGGVYAMFNQTLYQPPGEIPTGRGVRMFLIGGATEAHISAIDDHVGGGVSLTGPTQSRSNDIIGLGAEYAQLSSEAGTTYPYELSIEAFYLAQLTPWMQIQPDLQFIEHPSGQLPNALVLTIRTTIQF
jgi:porin